ncbi:MAG: three-Cys-motif partner protein TcmP [Acidobacteria bacterium]|nr:three-Cys-motif partner protein TcmP [Acidobacteriota bacterium]MCA1636976.1 three-Cys-motif partner protein TcmP [Acidobacteriota bacterium]
MEKLPRISEIGYWSEIKLEIIREYAKKYSIILSKQSYLKHIYIDAFAGAGIHISKTSKEIVAGSPLNALYVEPPFKELHLIDLDGKKARFLAELTKDYSNVFVYQGDCNKILLEKVFPNVRYEDYRRGLCLLDPFGLHLKWEVLKKAGEMKSLDVFLNFPTMDMNRTALLRNPNAVEQEYIDRMTSFWGDESWKKVSYSNSPQGSLFGEEIKEKESNQAIAERFRERRQKVAGFQFVPEPIPMRNSTGATLYYLFFASQNETANKIGSYILRKYKDKELR